jgi:maltose alpha-D-glucosyltransferase/alpha-amylase
VLNHTSDQHPWFQRARRSRPGSSWRDFYVWSDVPEKYPDARIIFKDFESSNWSWDRVANAYYWHRFYSHQPDLNFDNPDVRKHLFQVLDFWLKIGVDGMRLDAIPYLYEREGTNCENLPETHAFLKDLRRHIDQRFASRMLLAEANQWPEDAVAYFGGGHECHMAFHFPLMPRMFMAVRMEDRFPIIDILDQTPSAPSPAQWALFLRNHDELTLEMVTDEERDYMYRVYAGDPQMRINVGIRRRLAPLLGGDRRKIELLHGLLFSLPGTPVLYYGDEIGMGDNIYLGDRNGVRTPMQWSGDRNAGFSRAGPQRLYLPIVTDPEYHFEAVNVEAGQNNPSSLLWWIKRLIALRKRYRVFGRGSLEFVYPDNRKVLAFVRRDEERIVLVVANLSRFTQFAEIDLSAFSGLVPVELFGRTAFPQIGTAPYFVTLGPHNFFWFSLEKRQTPEVVPSSPPEEALPELSATGAWHAVLKGRGRYALEDTLPGYLVARRWFGGKAQRIKAASILDAIVVAGEDGPRLAIVQVEYMERDPETYLLPVGFSSGEASTRLKHDYPQACIARLKVRTPRTDALEEGVLYDAAYDPEFDTALLDAIRRRRRFKTTGGEVAASRTRAFGRLAEGSESLAPSLLRAEQTNTSIVYGDRFILKLVRRTEEGRNPDLEMGAFLTEKTSFANVPPLAGMIERKSRRGVPTTLAILQGFVPNQGDAWRFTLDSLDRFFERVLARHEEVPGPFGSALELVDQEISPLGADLLGTYPRSAELLGRRTAELHRALTSHPEDAAFAPEPFSQLDQRSLFQSVRSLVMRSFQLLRKRLRLLEAPTRELAESVLSREEAIDRRLRRLLEMKIGGRRIRVHGDYHLGQVLYTGKDFVIIDFEGEPARPLSARRLKRPAPADVAGMLRSFHYAAYSALTGVGERGVVRPEDLPTLEPWAAYWNRWISAIFLKSYTQAAADSVFLPSTRKALRVLLDVHLFEKAAYEVDYELNNRPGWVRVPLAGIADLLESEE